MMWYVRILFSPQLRNNVWTCGNSYLSLCFSSCLCFHDQVAQCRRTDDFTIPIFSGLPFISSLVVIQCSPCREENTNEREGICPISIVNPLCLPDQGNTNQELYPPIILKYCHLINRCLALGPIAIRARVYICNTGTSIPRTRWVQSIATLTLVRQGLVRDNAVV